MNNLSNLQHYEREARRLRAEFAGDLIVRAMVALDIAIRRTAYRILVLAGGGQSHRPGSRKVERPYGELN